MDGQTCDDVIKDTPWKCYEEKYRSFCCDACEKIRNPARTGENNPSINDECK